MGTLRLRPGDHRLGIRGKRCRAPRRGEGLPSRCDGGRYGIQRIEYLDDVLILSGAGVGGGSHVYAKLTPAWPATSRESV